jgi:hypothetical protein
MLKLINLEEKENQENVWRYGYDDAQASSDI